MGSSEVIYRRRAGWMFTMALITAVTCLVAHPSSALEDSMFVFEHQDPAGDVQFFNATENGTFVEKEGLDIKHVTSGPDGVGNVILTMDLKSREHFLRDDNASYVFRIFTSPDNRTGYEITYVHGTTEMATFSNGAKSAVVPLTDNTSLMNDRGDEILMVEVEISRYLDNISHFDVDAYSMISMDNSTYLDYISELPGHPDYIDPGLEEEVTDGAPSEEEEDWSVLIAILVVIAILFFLGIAAIIAYWMWKKR